MTTARESTPPRLGIDLGGTKIAGIVLDGQGTTLAEQRIASPHGDYGATIAAVAGLVADLETRAGVADQPSTIGIGMPGSVSPATGLVQNANSTWLNGKPFDRDLAARLGRSVICANDANCFALSEATDGAAAGAASVFGVILGTGCGGGIVVDGHLIDGPRGIGGEWGHNPLPWPAADELPGPRCWCGRSGCIETWVSGPALSADHLRTTGQTMTAAEIAAAADRGEAVASQTLERHATRLARGLASIVNIVDPDVIVLGGGLSNLGHLYRRLPELIRPHIFSDDGRVDIRPPKWGDASGVRGAAWLWT
jgi:fructokinase